MGGPGTYFNQHVEENLLNAINYLFDLDNTYPKHWYCLRPEDQTLFEEYMKKRCPELFRDCANYIGHRTIMVDPEVILKKLKLKVYYGIQNPGMFAITFSGSYHFGYNEGFNLAEVFMTQKYTHLFLLELRKIQFSFLGCWFCHWGMVRNNNCLPTLQLQ